MQVHRLRQRIDELVRVYDQLTLDELVDMIWRTEDMGFDDPPYEQVTDALGQMQNDDEVNWNPNEKMVSAREGRDIRTMRVRSYLNLTKWRTTFIGEYLLPNHERIDLTPVYDILLRITKPDSERTQKLTDPHLGLGEFTITGRADGNLEVDWIINETRSQSFWTGSGFHIHSYVFEEPIPEVIQYLQSQGPSRRDLIMTMLPTGGALLLFSVVRNVLKTVYPHLVIRMVDIDVNLTKGG